MNIRELPETHSLNMIFGAARELNKLGVKRANVFVSDWDKFNKDTHDTFSENPMLIPGKYRQHKGCKCTIHYAGVTFYCFEWTDSEGVFIEGIDERFRKTFAQ